jgi:large subunit ribosomal protein L10
MSKAMKETIARELCNKLKGVQDFVLVDYQGLSAKEAGNLRSTLRDKDLSLVVVRNSLLQRALLEMGVFGPEDIIKGPTALIFGSKDAIATARVLKEWNKKNKEISIKGGLLEGVLGIAEEAKTWAALPSRPEVLAGLLNSLIAPAKNIASLFHSTLSAFPSLLDAHARKKEEEGKEEGKEEGNENTEAKEENEE